MANLRANRITSTEVFETTGSVQFDGSGDYLSLAVSSDFQFGSEDFTIECWIYRKSQQNDDILGVYNTSSNRRTFILQAIDDGKITFILSDNGTAGTVFSSSTGELDISTWYHIAVIRNGNDIKIFKNGSLVKSGTFSGSIYNNTNDGFRIGSTDYSAANSREFEGHISNVRILKGQALYTENFTPPTRELEVIPNTVLLACQSTTKADEEKTGKTITVNGNAVANELTPGLLTNVVKSGGSSAITGSVEFDDNDYLTLASSDDFNLGTGDFTIEFWIHPQKDFVSYPTIFEIDATDNANRLLINFRNTSTLGLTSGTTVFATNTGFNLDSWFHVAVVRESGVSKIYKNGISGGDTACTADFSNSGSSNIFIGWDSTTTSTEKYNGFISNLRIIKGTALYTSDFIPPTRNLTKLPGTVLLCCTDSNDPTTEATGKTITGYGDLEQDPPELVTDGGFDSAANWPSAGADWTISGGVATISSADSGYDFLGTLTSSTTNGLLYELTFDISNWTAGRLELAQSNSGNRAVTVTGNGSYTYRWTYTGTTNGNIALYAYTGSTSSFTLDNVSLKRVSQKRKGSNFTPSVGSDGSVEFAGPTTINTENYFYLPTGPTEQRDSDGGHRGLFMGGQAGSQIEYITISNQSNALDFGDLSVNRTANTAASSSSRGISAGGYSAPASSDVIDYVTIASTGDAQDFGDLTEARRNLCGLSNSTRGIFGGGANPGLSNTIDYITIPSAGSAQDFGNLTTTLVNLSACSSPTRGIIGGGESPGTVNTIQYITIPSKGDAQDFGDLTGVRSRMGSCSSNTRGLFGSGRTPAQVNTIDYVTIASTGNAQDFGDVTDARESLDGTSDNTRGIFAGGYPNTNTNLIEFVIIQSMGNAFDFGDLITPTREFGACSNGHGGLG